MNPKLGKAIELLALGAGGVGGYGIGRLIAGKALEKNPNYAEEVSDVTEDYISRHPRLSKLIKEKSMEKSAGTVTDWVKHHPTSVGTVAGMLGLGALAGIPAGAFMKWKEENERKRFDNEFSNLDKAELATSLATDQAMETIGALLSKRPKPGLPD